MTDLPLLLSKTNESSETMKMTRERAEIVTIYLDYDHETEAAQRKHQKWIVMNVKRDVILVVSTFTFTTDINSQALIFAPKARKCYTFSVYIS